VVVEVIQLWSGWLCVVVVKCGGGDDVWLWLVF